MLRRNGATEQNLLKLFQGLIALCFVIKFTTKDKILQLLRAAGYRDVFILCTAGAQILGGIIFTIGLEHARSGAILTAVSACYPAITIFLAVRYLNEKQLIIPLIGSMTAVAGIVVLSVS